MINLLKWDEFKTLDTIYQLVQLGLLEKAEAQKPLNKKVIGKDFFRMLETELKKVLGPIAPLIIQKKLTSLEKPRIHLASSKRWVKKSDDQARDEIRKEAVKFFSIETMIRDDPIPNLSS
jgi:hypothetical protein